MATNNSQNENLSGDDNAPRVFKTNEATSLTDIALGLVGTTHKGVAFVPQTFQTFDLDDRPGGTLNTFENQFGSLEDLNDHNLTHYSAYEWFNQGGEQLSIIRVLGTGDESGFTVGEEVVSGSTELGKVGESSFATVSGSNGGTYFLGQVIENDQFESTIDNGVTTHRISSYNDYLEQIGISVDKGLVLTECLFAPHGSTLFLEKTHIGERDLQDIKQNLSSQDFISQQLLNSKSNLENPRFFIRGLQSNNHSIIDSFNNESLRSYQYNESKINIDSRWNLHKGHLNYASWGSQIDFKIRSFNPVEGEDQDDLSKVFLVNKQDGTPNYDDFRSAYKTAETPWIVSQPLDREGLQTSRASMHTKCMNLFKFVALDDGEVGNRYRIRITPQRSGNRITKDWAKFGVTVWEYDIKTNAFTKQLQYKDLDLNPNSPDYIGRVFGTKHEYYSTATGKVQTDGIYETRNNHLRVVINDKIEYGEVDSWDLIPSGFKPYPRINTDNLNFLDADPLQKPIEYMSNLLFTRRSSFQISAQENLLLEKDKHWGVCFENTSQLQIINKVFGDNRFTVRVKKYSSYEDNSIRRFTQYAKYFQDSLENNNVWVRDLEDNDEDSTNSFFHLEKILKEGIDNVENASIQDQWLYSTYRRDGKSPEFILSLGEAWKFYKYVNIEEELKVDGEGDSVNSYFLSFDFFTCGGFDGLNILDHDKYMMNQSALIREIEDEKQNGSASGTTRLSYELAHDILTDDANAEIDALVFPSVGHNVFNKRIANVCNEKESYLSVLNVADFYSDGINLEPEYHEFIPTENDQSDKIKIRANVEKLISYGTNITLDSVSNSYFNSKYVLNVCNTTQSTYENSIFTNLPSFRVVSAMPRSLSRPLDSITEFNSSDIKILKILNKTLRNLNNNDYSRLIKNSLKRNVNFLVTSDNQIVLNSSNTSIEIRNSLNRFAHNVRIMIDIKKKIKYLMFQSEVLFNNNSSIDNIAFVLNENVQSLLQSYVDRGVIKDFYVKNNTGQTAIERLDMQKNILRSSIAISLFGKSENVIEEIRLADLLNTTQNSLTEAADLDIILPTV